MLRCLLLLILLSLPSVASADAVEFFGPDIAPAGESAVASADEPVLDLSLEPAAVAAPPRRTVPSLPQPASGGRATEAPFSVGLDIRTRHEVGDEARQEAPEEPTLTDEVAGVVKRSTFGLTGTYRF